MSREIMQQSLKLLIAYQDCTMDSYITNKCGLTIQALKQELAKPEQEPEIVRRVGRYAGKRRESVGSPHITAKECIALANWIDSMLAAPPRKPWVGLTDEEILDLWIANHKDTGATDAFARAIEAALKEKNT